MELNSLTKSKISLKMVLFSSIDFADNDKKIFTNLNLTNPNKYI